MTLQQAMDLWVAAHDKLITGTPAERRRARRVAGYWGRIVAAKRRAAGDEAPLRLTPDTYERRS